MRKEDIDPAPASPGGTMPVGPGIDSPAQPTEQTTASVEGGEPEGVHPALPGGALPVSEAPTDTPQGSGGGGTPRDPAV